MHDLAHEVLWVLDLVVVGQSSSSTITFSVLIVQQWVTSKHKHHCDLCLITKSRIPIYDL